MKRVFQITIKSNCNHKEFEPTCLWCAHLNLMSRQLTQMVVNKNSQYSDSVRKKLMEIEEVKEPDLSEFNFKKIILD